MAEIDYDEAMRRASVLIATGISVRKACRQAAEEQGSENPTTDMARLRKRFQRDQPERVKLRRRKSEVRQWYRDDDRAKAQARRNLEKEKEKAAKLGLPTEPGQWKVSLEHSPIWCGRSCPTSGAGGRTRAGSSGASPARRRVPRITLDSR